MKKLAIVAVVSAMTLVSCGSAETEVKTTENPVIELTEEQIEEVSTIEAENEILQENLDAIKSEEAALEELLNEL